MNETQAHLQPLKFAIRQQMSWMRTHPTTKMNQDAEQDMLAWAPIIVQLLRSRSLHFVLPQEHVSFVNVSS
jgi:hypothetical protein